MSVVDTYGKILKKVAPNHRKAAYRMLLFGLFYEHFHCMKSFGKDLPQVYRYLARFAVDDVRESLKHPEQTVWANIFSPVEILQAFGLRTLSVECLSSFLSGFKIEDYLLDYAEGEGISPTLCSYHRNFIGAVDSGLIPPAAYALTTSTICDGNLGTFRHLSEKHGIPMFLLDVPGEGDGATEYLVAQLKELIGDLEEKFGKKIDMQLLSESIVRENKSREHFNNYLESVKTNVLKSTLTHQMYMLFASHLDIGRPEILEFYRMLDEEAAAAPRFDGKKILWVHLLPYYQQTLMEYFNTSDDYMIQTMEMNLDWVKPLDPDHPLEALAEKMISNLYTGSFERKAEMVVRLAKDLGSDGVINFCHWGCKQSSGGVGILREKLREEGIPLLVIDGDGIDRRNSHDGQIRTRVEAFLEILKS